MWFSQAAFFICRKFIKNSAWFRIKPKCTYIPEANTMLSKISMQFMDFFFWCLNLLKMKMKIKIKAAFGRRCSQLLLLVFRAHAFQTAKRCVFCKKFLYKSCLKNHINLFLKKNSKYLINHVLIATPFSVPGSEGWEPSLLNPA